MYPALDRDLVRSWWFGSGKTYFDFKDAEGSFPNEGKVVQGKTVDLFRFLLEGIKAHGIQGNKIGIDGELYPSESARAHEILPDVEWVNVDQTLMDMRIVKTPEELALWRRAYVYFDRAHDDGKGTIAVAEESAYGRSSRCFQSPTEPSFASFAEKTVFTINFLSGRQAPRSGTEASVPVCIFVNGHSSMRRCLSVRKDQPISEAWLFRRLPSC